MKLNTLLLAALFALFALSYAQNATNTSAPWTMPPTNAPNTTAPNNTIAPTKAPNATLAPNGTHPVTNTSAPNATVGPTVMPTNMTTPAPTKSVGDTVCQNALANITKGCSGFALLYNDSEINARNLPALCGCVSDAMLTTYRGEFFLASTMCESSVRINLRMVRNMMCATNNGTYCHPSFSAAKAYTGQVKELILSSGAVQSGVASTSVAQSVCNTCFDNTVAGMASIVGEAYAFRSNSLCDSKCQADMNEAINAAAELASLSLICIKNDNRQDTANPYCLSRVYSVLSAASKTANCDAKATTACTGDCVVYDGKCRYINDVAIFSNGFVKLPAFSHVDHFCMDSCYNRVQASMFAFGKLLVDSMLLRNTTSQLVQAKSVLDMNIAPQYTTLDKYMCLSSPNNAAKCLARINSVPRPNNCTDAEVNSFFTSGVTCSSTCAVGMKAWFDSFDCCTGVFEQLYALDSTTKRIPNIKGISTACNLAIPAACSAFNSAPVTVSDIPLSGTCSWLTSSLATNLAILKNSTAQALGMSVEGMLNFAVKAASGAACTGTAHHRNAHVLNTAALGLKASFAVVARDNATAQRLATAAQSSTGIAIHSVEVSASQMAQSTANTETEKVVTIPTAAPTTVAPTTTPAVTATPAPTATPTLAPKSSAMKVVCSVLMAIVAVMMVIA